MTLHLRFIKSDARKCGILRPRRFRPDAKSSSLLAVDTRRIRMSTGTLKNYMPRVAFSFLSVTLFLVAPGSNQGFAQSAIGPARTSGSITVLDLPRVADYWVSATRQPGG